MASSAEELRRRVLALFTDSVEGDAQIATLWETVHSGSQNVSYLDAYSFAGRVGEKLAAAFRAVQGDIPEHIDADFALTLLYETLRGDYTLVADVAAAVQDVLNKQVPLGLKAATAPLDTENIYSLAGRLAGYETTEEGLWVPDAPVVTFSRSVVDKTVEVNVEQQGNAGLRPRVVRTMHGEGCSYCSPLAGVWDYPDVPKDVYRRHNNCRCTVTYDPGAGKRVQDVWSKRWRAPDEQARVEARKHLSQTRKGKNVLPEYMRDAKPGKGVLEHEDGYNIAQHEKEIAVAQWMHDTLGGDIKLLTEINKEHQKTPDYLWRNRFWDLKKTTTEQAANSAIRHGLQQIREKPGGIILDFDQKSFSMQKLQDIIEKRMQWNHMEQAVDILVLSKRQLVAALRYSAK